MTLYEEVKAVRNKLSLIRDVNIHDIVLSGKLIKEEEVEDIEKRINFRFPEYLREFYINKSSKLSFKWNMDSNIFGDKIKYGGINLLSPNEILEVYSLMQEQVKEAQEDPEELSWNEGLNALTKDWPFWVPVISFENGDAFCIDQRDGSVVFLEHDVADGGPNVHGLKIALSFEDLIKKWSKIGFVDIYDWSEGINSEGIDIELDIFKQLMKVL